MPIPSGPKGTRDFYPTDMALQEFVFSSWAKTCRRYGFEPYEGPMFESLDLYTQKSGNEIEGQLYLLTDKGGRNLALRPEMTPTLARMVAAAGSNLKQPARWYSIPRLFRYERMQKGRLREFFQLNMDILGIQGIEADAELIAAVIDMMRDLGFDARDFAVRISSRTLLEELFIAAGVMQDACPRLYALLDRKAKIGNEDYARELEAIVPDGAVRGRIEAVFRAATLDEIAVIGDDNIPSVNELRRLFERLASYGFADYAVFDLGVVRGLAYYTGIVFEVFDRAKSLRAIAGGGRYDKLVELYGGSPTPAVGFAAGDVVLAELLKTKGISPPHPPRSSCYLVDIDQNDAANLIATARRLRDAGISCEFPLKNQGVGKQMKQANAARARLAVFVGGDEGRAGTMRVKSMASGDEAVVAVEELVETVRRLLEEKAY